MSMNNPGGTGGAEVPESRGNVAGMLHELAAQVIAAGEGPRLSAPLPVNLPMIRHWAEAMGDRDPRYAGPDAVAPPAMIQVWTMAGLVERGERPRIPLDDMLEAIDEHGYTGVVATDCEHTYQRYLRPGEELTSATRMSDLAGPKRTALGEGYFITWLVTWYSGTEPVADMMFRVLKFRPGERKYPPEEQEPHPLRQAIGGDGVRRR
ncbi:FAS1-like dehydratase domain-containing protein [Microtetraspora glauca]|uniref:MaoC family dehydratase N-terminal domain-containing protein n=1 Tax=Microtetraspora glauca TaxID=1996 RepID=A0ABV3GF33_MICGL